VALSEWAVIATAGGPATWMFGNGLTQAKRGSYMRAPYGLEIIDSCLDCKLRSELSFCDLHRDAIASFEAARSNSIYPKGSILFVEGQPSRGVYLICKGRAKLSTCSSDGRILITRIAGAGEVLGASATISGKPYEVTAETLSPCQIAFVRDKQFLQLLEQNPEVSLRLAQHLSNSYFAAYEQVRSLGLSHTAGEKLARLLLSWCAEAGAETENGVRVKVTLTHEEIAQLIGTSRETVTRLFSALKTKNIMELKGSTLLVRDEAALEHIVDL
jgi:CRP/FNR family transcriptional regulator, cyclic AMP receptor protein